MQLKKIGSLIKNVFVKFFEDNAIHYSASLSFFTIFSLPPIIIIIVNIAGMLMGKETVSEEIYKQFDDLLGLQGGEEIRRMVDSAQRLHTDILTKVIGVFTLLFASTGVFVAMQSSLNTIWQVKTKPKRNIIKLLEDRMLSFAMIVSIAFILLVSLIVHALVMIIINLFEEQFSISALYIIKILDYSISLIMVTILFAMIFKFLPDVKIRWKDVWIGAFVTAILFSLGKFLISIYFGNSHIGSAYGAAGSIVLLLLWVFYSSIIFFVGAEFTQAYAKTYGKKIEPAEYAVRVEKKIIESDSDSTT